MKTVEIERESPPGAWREAQKPEASCAACKQTTCNHPDPIYDGVMPLPEGWA